KKWLTFPIRSKHRPSSVTSSSFIVEGTKLHVSKQFLATHSPVFDAMFFGQFAEKDTRNLWTFSRLFIPIGHRLQPALHFVPAYSNKQWLTFPIPSKLRPSLVTSSSSSMARNCTFRKNTRLLILQSSMQCSS
ncbi:hypothetical protein PMAYCL1PPCAC_25482, partial [Pristionchus mayeri]